VVDVNYVALIDDGGTGVLSQEEFKQKLSEWQTSKDWETIYAKDNIYLFRRIVNGKN
jgi:hypothetical protein